VVRIWSILFIIAALASVGVFVYAPFNEEWWLPHNVSLTSPLRFGADIDHLFVLILWITGIVFIGTQIALGYATWKFAATPGGKASYTHGSQRLEVVWTIIPSAILVFIALYQMGTWSSIKFRSSQPKVKPIAEVTARQFQWLMRYAGPDGKMNTPDDLHTINDLHFVKNTPVVIHLKSKDVLHSFFLPQFRIKQDAVPGLTIPVWFDADTEGSYDLVCAELCGWGHYKMRGNVTVHATQSEFDEWQKQAVSAQSASQLTSATTQGSNGN
jgi:cytochrome c oxidase subunit 2